MHDNVETHKKEKIYFYPEAESYAINPQHYNSVGVRTGTRLYRVIQMPCRKQKRQYKVVREGSSSSLDRQGELKWNASSTTGRTTLGKF